MSTWAWARTFDPCSKRCDGGGTEHCSNNQPLPQISSSNSSSGGGNSSGHSLSRCCWRRWLLEQQPCL
jgi:hypothetical protein